MNLLFGSNITEKGKGVAQDEAQVLACTYIQYMLAQSAEMGTWCRF